MASTVACHIVLPQGCAAADKKWSGGRKKKTFRTSVGMSARYTESPFKRTLVPREQKMPEMKSYHLQASTEETDLPPSLCRQLSVPASQPLKHNQARSAHLFATLPAEWTRNPTGAKGGAGGIASSLARTAASVRLDRHVNARWRDLHLSREVTFPTNALPPKAVQKAQMCSNVLKCAQTCVVVVFFFFLRAARGCDRHPEVPSSQTQFLNKKQEKPRRIIELLRVYSGETVSTRDSVGQSAQTAFGQVGDTPGGKHAPKVGGGVEEGFKAAKWGKNSAVSLPSW